MNRIKKGLIVALCLVLAFTVMGCSGNKANNTGDDERVLEAINLITEKWNENYNAFFKGDDKHLEIVNTRIVKVKDGVETSVAYMQNIDYVVEFVLLANENDLAPHYVASDMNNSVYVYKDGTKKVYGNLYKSSFMTGEEFSGIVDSVEDLGSQYNRVIDFE